MYTHNQNRMTGGSPNFQRSRFSGGTPTRSHSYGSRQPLHLQQNCNYMTPRGGRMFNPRNNSASPDFIPLGISSPIRRDRQSWGKNNHSNNSSLSGWSSPSSSNSSPRFSPYNNHGSRGNFRRRGSFNNSNNSPISAYVCKDALEDPWLELEKKMNLQQIVRSAEQQEKASTPTTIVRSSDSDVSSDNGEEDDGGES
ncbi:basic-leucine zipper transcription factor A-like [Homalodisca vitripennis]|uniref:basic-leucine zipper transcription factor A-like n=1 Tax=Homalodisca vitripennis TaxID=197043 RepID=UPI001EEC17CF|nr:basic-leucine zipper transcription factor A-like [Homalodisca vitripennis]